MTYGKKIAFLVLLAALILAVSSSAFAATVTVHNSLDKKLSLAFCYRDLSGREVTKGWWYVEAGGETAVTLDADESEPIYYAAFNKDLFADASTVKDPQVKGWLSYSNFTFGADEEPDEDNAFNSRFFKVPDGGTVNVNGNSRGR
jgi:hypothetical protein